MEITVVFRDGSRASLKDVVSYAEIEEHGADPAIAFHGKGRQRWEVPKKNVRRVIVGRQDAGSTVSGEAIVEDSPTGIDHNAGRKGGAMMEDASPPRKA